MIYTTLISATELQSLLASGRPIAILDTSFDLTDKAAGERAYREAHLPGAVYAHLDRDLAAPPTGRNGRHPLPSRDAFARTAGRLGIAPGVQVVVYDRQGAMFAARAWWMLRWLGHAAVAVLDGGFAAWAAAGGRVETGESTAAAQPPYPPAEALVAQVDIDAVAGRHADCRLIDARAPERYRGETEPLDARAGHIPGALNRFFKDNLDAAGRFRSADELRREFTALVGDAPQQVIHQCGSGATACHNLLAMEVAGLSGSKLYVGSWSEWSSDPARPAATGAEPG